MNERLKALRNELRLNQSDFSKKLGTAQSTYAALELGRTKLRDRHINLICSTFNVNRDWLVSGEGEMFKSDLAQNVGVNIARMFSKGDDLTKKLIIGLSELDENEIEIVKILVDGLINKKKQL